MIIHLLGLMNRLLNAETYELAQKLIQDFIYSANTCFTSRGIHQYFKKMTGMSI